MARPIEYNQKDVLNGAMRTFWQYGYEATSMKMLVEATGLTTRSMYNLFGSKNGLFNASLNWYFEKMVSSAFNNLDDVSGIESIRTFALSIADFMDEVSSRNSLGCFYTNTMTEMNSVDVASVKLVGDYFSDLESKLYKQLLYAVENEGLIGDPIIKSKQIVTMIQGISVYSKSNCTGNICHEIIADYLRSIGIK